MIDTAILFGLMHGFLAVLPLFVLIGYALAWLRNRTGSVYPGMVMHGSLQHGGARPRHHRRLDERRLRR